MNTRLDFLLTPGYADAAGPAAPLPDDGGGTLVAAQVEKNQSELPPAQRHIIKRPRLTRLLDEAEARVLLLVAPAGYGKTTLARAHTSRVWPKLSLMRFARLLRGLRDTPKNSCPRPPSPSGNLAKWPNFSQER